ncbi:MAG: hypothetical protein DRP75_02980 [Candidatus Omnitrophota bacterium]|nr:MAG: hypothetical protein DRP75_02980 [Candidatus Omnitrophota bacterium]
MEFLQDPSSTFRFSILAIVQIFVVGFCGFVAAKREILSQEGLKVLSRLIVEISLPALIFSRLLLQFKFNLFPHWWFFPLFSFFLTFLGLGIGYLFLKLSPPFAQKREFLSLIGFQNAGYLPLALATTLFPPHKADQMFIYIFLFLLGFNALLWSFGVHLLSPFKKKMRMVNLFTPPLLATLSALLLIFLNLRRFFPSLLLKPLQIVGECTVPLGLMVIGGSLAFVSPQARIKKGILMNLILAKLIALPLLVFLLIICLKPEPLIGFLMLIESGVPSATSLSIIAKHYSADCDFVNQSIFFTHLLSLFTLPLFLTLFGWWVRI